ncbi:6362_t:CDS:2, partial [Funneliformis geosporum]
MQRECYFDQISCLTSGSNVKNSTNAGGSMYAKSDESLEEFVKQQFGNLAVQMNIHEVEIKTQKSKYFDFKSQVEIKVEIHYNGQN